MIEDIVHPLANDIREYYQSFPANKWGAQVTFFEGDLPELDQFDLAIFGVKEERKTFINKGCCNAPNIIRHELYKLINSGKEFKVLDLGNIEPGATANDTYFAISSVAFELLKNKVIPIILGGSHDLTYGQYLSYQNFGKDINMVVVDEKIDLEDLEDEITENNHLAKILTHQPNFLKGFSQLGYQSYFTDVKAVETLEKLDFDVFRLGNIHGNITEVEPIVRDADLLSFDISAIRQSDAPAKKDVTPNGFLGEEACQIARYAGLSDGLSSLGIYNMNPECDNRNQTAQLVAQMVWYFVEGYYCRKGEAMMLTEKDYYKYIVDLANEKHELVFWKSKKSERWWMEIAKPDKKGKKTREDLVPCSYADYQQACNGEIPERWLKAYQKVLTMV